MDMTEIIKAIHQIENVADLKLVSRKVHARWTVLSRVEAAVAATQFGVGDVVRLKRRGLVGKVVRFGPKNIFVRVETMGGATEWRCHPSFLEKAT